MQALVTEVEVVERRGRVWDTWRVERHRRCVGRVNTRNRSLKIRRHIRGRTLSLYGPLTRVNAKAYLIPTHYDDENYLATS